VPGVNCCNLPSVSDGNPRQFGTSPAPASPPTPLPSVMLFSWAQANAAHHARRSAAAITAAVAALMSTVSPTSRA